MRSRLRVLCIGLFLVIVLVATGCNKSTPASQTPSAASQEATTAPAEAAAPAATNTPRPTATSWPTMPPTSAPTVTPPTTPTPTAAPTDTPSPEPTATSEPTATPKPGVSALPSVPKPPAVVASAVLTLLDDANFAPPLSVHVSANQALEGYRFRISGTLRNDAAENYAGLGIVATFYTSDGSRYGPVKANPPCLLLAPGDECPFIVEVLSKDLVSVMLHPEGYPTTRGSAPLTLSGLGRYQDSVGYVHLTGRVHNANPFAVKNVTVSGVLLNGTGEIVSLGMTILVDNVASNGSTTFDIAVKYTPYTNYRFYVQGEPQ